MALVSFLMRSFRTISCLVVILVLLAGCNTPAETQVLVVKETVVVTASPVLEVTAPSVVVKVTLPPVVQVTPAVMEATSTDEFVLTSFASPSGAVSFLRPSAFDSCQEGKGSSSATWQASCSTTPPQRLLAVVFNRISSGPATDAIWDNWVQQKTRTMENPVAFQVHDRQVDAQMRTAAGGNVWAHWEEHEGLIAGLLMVVPVTEEQTWAPVWVKVWPSLRWDPAAVSRLTSDVPTPAPTQPVAPVETPDLAACLSSCDAYTDPDQWYQCISECSDGPTPTDVPLPTPDPCLDSCMVYTTRNEFDQCIAKCLPSVTPLPTKDPIPIRVCHQECDVAFDSCLDNCGNISAPVAAMSCIGTCEATSATCNVNCDW